MHASGYREQVEDNTGDETVVAVGNLSHYRSYTISIRSSNLKISRIGTLVLIAILLQLAWYLLPQLEYRWMSEDAIVLTSYAGLDSQLGLSPWMSWAILAITLSVLFGLFFFESRARYVALLYFALSIILITPLAGMNVETGLSIALRDLSNLVIGAAIALSFALPMPSNR